jgi:hypothetical protein
LLIILFAALSIFMKHFLRIFPLMLLTFPAFADVHNYTVSGKDIHDGFIVERIDLQYGAIPSVKLLQPSFTGVKALPKDTRADAPDHFTLKIGAELKRPFVLVQIPAYSLRPDGGYQVITSFSLDVSEAAQAVAQHSTAKITATASPLSSGTWYKIAVPERGVYKIDYDFIKSMGVGSGTISSAGIRLVGNGGTIISENNAVPRPFDLTENAIWVSDGGDGTFGSGDFIAFYAGGPTRWDKDSLNQRFIHANNLYADSSYYFISFDAGNGLRLADAPATGPATTSVTTFNDYVAHELDLYNPGKFGKEWWGEKFGAAGLMSRDLSFNLGSNTDSLRVRLSVAGRSTSYNTSMSVTLNGSPFSNYMFKGVVLEDDNSPVSPGSSDLAVQLNASTAAFHLNFISSAPEDLAYLNYIELNWRRPLAFAGSNFTFRDWRGIAPGAVAAYTVAGASAATQVWDITNPLQPKRMVGSLSGSNYTFTQQADMLHEFVALNGSTFATPIYISKVDNQNLHGADAPSLVIVTYPDFLDAANRLADYHRQHDGMKVLVATTQQVYNEFSSGSQDISGIRDMMRYYYQVAGSDTSRMPHYLLLFGDASYDYKNRIIPNANYVPTFESADGVDVDNSYTVDDFFGFLDDNENISDFSLPNTLDIGIGRLPVNTPAQADAVVNKIIGYHAPASLGPWRLMNTYIGDNEDNAGEHLMDAEYIAAQVDAMSPFSNDFKIYLDNLPFVSTPGGLRCPEANKAINDQIFKGTFLINYTGHGSTVTLAHERILIKDDFNKWKNLNKLPFMVTATCDYARYDNPGYTSDGEALILKSDGGTIAMLTTTGPVFAGINRDINGQFLAEQYTQHNGEWPTFGDAIRRGKNITFITPSQYSRVNFYRFTLLGDPALQPAFPKHRVHTDSIRTLPNNTPTDSLRALGSYTVSGHISDVAGNMLNDFNGRAYITIYDKARTISLNTKEYGQLRKYSMRDNVIFKGITTVTNGHFSFAFIAPKDINYDFGKGRISYYAENGVTDAAGMDTTLTVGGYFDGAEADNVGPEVQPYIGDTLFHDGGLTGTNTLLYVKLSDHSGINVSGNGVGHDLTGVLDGDEQHPYILNDYYQTEPNTYQRGHVSFPLSNIPDGLHTIVVKAWDVYNNSGSGTVHFVVGDGKVMQVENLINYPNPFSDVTHFFFEHNHPNEVLNVQIAIYNTAGLLVRTINQSFTPTGSHSNEITWDGTANNGARLQSGVYPYRIILSTEKGIEATSYQKLVIVR